MNKLVIEPSPHLRSRNTVNRIMLDVIIALLPSVITGAIVFGPRALAVTAVCIGVCVISEYIFKKIVKKPSTISDLSASVTGIILACNLPVTVPFWIAALGSMFAIIVVKQFFGGLGQNFANPAITARIFLFVSFAGRMTNWVTPFYYLSGGINAVTSATPLVSETPVNLLDLFLGSCGGCIGETGALAILIGFVYLLVRRVITVTTPFVYVFVVFALTAATGGDGLYAVLSGGLLFGAVFMATDFATSPVTEKGKIVFAVGCGLLTFVIREYSSYPEGVSFSILLMNLLTPYIDKFTKLKSFGAVRGKKNED